MVDYLVLARKWRPQKFSEIVGQEHIVTTLQNALSKKRVAHAYLFTGPRGIGKTSTARILAKALNCKEGVNLEPCNQCSFCQEITGGRSLDVLEIDGASNRGIDEVRNLRENTKFGTSGTRYKIYIIDEVHMLTREAFNALLKTLEEPPAHVRFIFATTTPEKLPLTVLSRCQRFDFRRIPISNITQKLEEIAEKEEVKASKDVLYAIAKNSSGSLRDAESVLDQLATFSNKDIKVQEVNNLLGLVEEDVFFQMTELLLKREVAEIWKLIDYLVNEGKNIRKFLEDYLYFFRNLLLLREGYDSPDLVNINPSSKQKLKELAQFFSVTQILQLIDKLAEFGYRLKMSETPNRELEVSMLRLIREVDLPQADKPASQRPAPTKEKQPACWSTGGVETNPPQDLPEKRDIPKTLPVKTVEKEVEKEEKQDKSPDLAELKKVWSEVVKKISAEKNSLGAILKHSEVVSVNDSKVNIGVSKINSYSENFLNRNKKFIETLLKEKISLKLKVDFSSLTSSSVSEKKVSDKTAPGAGGEIGEEKAIVQKAVSIFEAKIVK